MITIYNLFLKFLRFFINVLFVVQIILIILVFLTATYWFFYLLESNLFSFAQPIADTISDFVKLFYTNKIKLADIEIDGSLLLFDFVTLIVVFLISKFKYYINILINIILNEIEIHKKKIENDFNNRLKSNAEAKIKKCNNIAIVITFEAKDTRVDNIWGGDPKLNVNEKQNFAHKTLISTLKNISYIEFFQDEDKLIILSKDFSKIDNLLFFIEQAIDRIQQNMKKDKWKLYAYMSIDVYDNNTDFKNDVYPKLVRILNIKQNKEFVCFSSFFLRYNIKDEKAYEIKILRGEYFIEGVEGGCNIYSLIKINN